MKKRWTKEEAENLHQWKIENNATIAATAKYVGVTKGALQAAFFKHGLKSRGRRTEVGEKISQPLQFEVQQRLPVSPSQVAVAFMSMDAFKEFVVSQWR